MGAPFHGRNGLIYVDGNEIVGANAWSIDVPQENAEARQFGETWVRRSPGFLSWSGSITAYDQSDEKYILDAAIGNVAVALLIYPTRADTSTYYSGSAIFGQNADGSSTGLVNASGSFAGDGALTPVGFA